jgi:hypothetical protein
VKSAAVQQRPEGARGCIDMRLRRDGGPPCSSEAENLGERQATKTPHSTDREKFNGE